MKLLLIPATLVLAGCICREPVVITKTAEVPVPVLCVDREDVPPMLVLEGDSVSKNDSVFTKAQAISIDRKLLIGQNTVLRALLEGCVEE